MVKVLLKRMSIWPMAKLHAIVMGVVGVIVGGLVYLTVTQMSYGVTSMISLSTGNTVGLSLISFWLSEISKWVLVVVPVGFVILGLIMGALTAVLYNLLTIKGTKLEMEEVEERS